MSKKLGIGAARERLARIAAAIITRKPARDEVTTSDKAKVKEAFEAKTAHLAGIITTINGRVTREDFTADMLRAIARAVQSNHNPDDPRYHEILKKALPPDGSNDLVALYLQYSAGDLGSLLVRLRHDAAAMFATVDMDARRQSNGNGTMPSSAD